MIRFTRHAREMIEERSLALKWVETAIAAPDWSEPDSLNPQVTRSFRRVAEAGDRILRVAHPTGWGRYSGDHRVS